MIISDCRSPGNARPLAGLFLSLTLVSCHVERTPSITATSQLTQNGERRVLTLSHTPEEVTRGAAVTTLAPDRVVGGGRDGFGYVVDVASSGTSLFVLDGLAREVRRFDDKGEEAGRFGRDGEGPGEYQYPIAIAASDSAVVTWQYPSTQALAVWSQSGGLRVAADAPVDGDWDSGQWKKPRFLSPITVGPEDLSHRLRFADQTTIVHQVQPDEEAFRREGQPYPYEVPPAYLVTYDLDLAVIDTLAVLSGARLKIIEDTVPVPNTGRMERIHFAHELLYASRPVWATGEGTLLLTHGDSAGAMIRGADGNLVLEIRWPDRRRPIDDTDKREAAQWMLAYEVISSTSSREMFEDYSRREIEEGIRVTAHEWTRFADYAPTVTAAFVAGECAFLAGFSPRENQHGIALTWIVINFRDGSLQGVVRFQPATTLELGNGGSIDRRGGAARAFTTKHAYVLTVDGDGESYVERFALPAEYDCGN